MQPLPAIVVLHGLGGTPRSVAPLTEALREHGFSVTAPLLAGHGTNAADLEGLTWDTWLRAVTNHVRDRHVDHSTVVLVGQSMGATLALAAAAELDCVIGVASINGVSQPPDPDATDHFEYLLSRGRTRQRTGEADLRDPLARDDSYTELPISALMELGRGGAHVHARLNRLTVALLIISSDHDSVVDPVNSDLLAANVPGRVTRLRLANSGHVAALDFDRHLLCTQLLTWLVNLTDSSADLPDESASS